MGEPQNEAQRRRAIAWAVALTAETPLAPEQYEAELLERYAQGLITIDQVLVQLDNRVQHILYRSRAVQPFTPAQRTALLEESRVWNEQHNITGLLCYSEPGYFVQVIEGSAPNVQALYARIKLDKRHEQITLLSDSATATRWFSDWRMAYTEPEVHDFFWLIGYLDARNQSVGQSQVPIKEPLLLGLLSKFSQA